MALIEEIARLYAGNKHMTLHKNDYIYVPENYFPFPRRSGMEISDAVILVLMSKMAKKMAC